MPRSSPSTQAVPIRWYRPESGVADEARPTLLWLHGGGFYSGGLAQPEAHAVAGALAERGVAVVTVDYRLAPPLFPALTARGNLPPSGSSRPRERFPAALTDASLAYRRLLAQSPGGVIVGGGSAGACLAAATTLAAIDAGSPPVGAVLAYGFFHADHPRADAGQRSRGYRRLSHSQPLLNAMNRNYAPTPAQRADRLAFPGGHDLAGFPRTLAVNAQFDSMRASGDRFAEELSAAGVDVQHRVLPGSRHAFLNRPGSRDFASAVELIAGWVTSRWVTAQSRV